MKTLEKPLVMLISNHPKKEFIQNTLEEDFKVVCKNRYDAILDFLKIYQVSVIVSIIGKEEHSILDLKEKISYPYPSISKIAVLEDNKDVELIRRCGEKGINSVVLYSEVWKLNNKVRSLIKEKKISVSLEEIGVKTEGHPEFLVRALTFMEENYLSIMGVEEITVYLSTTYKTLSTYFKKAGIANPKVILMFLKVRHSLYLLREFNWTIKEVAYNGGFSDDKRYAECFKRMFRKSPGVCINDIRDYSVEEFWDGNLMYSLIGK